MTAWRGGRAKHRTISPLPRGTIICLRADRTARDIPRETLNHPKAMAYRIRFALTLALAATAGALALVPRPLQTLELGRAAGSQFLPRDGAYLRFAAETAAWSHPGLGAVAGALFAAIWWTPLRRMLAAPVLMLAALAGAAAVLLPSDPAAAYYAKQDYAEPYLIYA